MTPEEQVELLTRNAAALYPEAFWYGSLVDIGVGADTAQVTTSNPLVASLMCRDLASVAFDSGQHIGIDVVRVYFDQTGGELAECHVPSRPFGTSEEVTG